MARPRSEAKRQTILSAATNLFAEEGLNASTAKIAKAAGVSEGTVFIYFPTKDELMNQLYLELKGELHSSLLASPFASTAQLEEQLWHAWKTYVDWGVTNPLKHQALATMTLSARISEETRSEGQKTFCMVSDLLQQAVSQGALREQPVSFAGMLMGAIGDATMAQIRENQAESSKVCRDGYRAFWNAITGM